MGKWTFVAMADIHIGSPRSYRYETSGIENWKTAKRMLMQIKPDLLLIAGDLTRDGNIHRFELEEVKKELDSLPFPYLVVPGNMDTGNKHTDRDGSPQKGRMPDTQLNITSEQLKNFCEFFGPLYWTVVHKNVRFSGFCDMLCGSGLLEEEEFWRWVELQKKLPKAKFHIWIMHYALFIEDINEANYDITDPDQYHCWYFGIDKPYRERLMELFLSTNTTRVIMGHIHCRKHRKVKGIYFDHLPCLYSHPQFTDHWKDGDGTPGFMKYQVEENGIKGTFIPLEKIAIPKGYGPGGHPAPELRDYSKAWGK